MGISAGCGAYRLVLTQARDRCLYKGQVPANLPTYGHLEGSRQTGRTYIKKVAANLSPDRTDGRNEDWILADT